MRARSPTAGARGTGELRPRRHYAPGRHRKCCGAPHVPERDLTRSGDRPSGVRGRPPNARATVGVHSRLAQISGVCLRNMRVGPGGGGGCGFAPAPWAALPAPKVGQPHFT